MFAHHAQPLLAEAAIHNELKDATADCQLLFATSARPRRSQLPLLSPEAIPSVVQSRSASKVALVFGSEQDGLSQEDIERCDAIVQLETPGSYHSYNLSHAVALVLYLATLKSLPVAENQINTLATTSLRERLLALWSDTLARYGYFRRTTSESFAPRLRALISRLSLSGHDANLLIGMMSHLMSAKKTQSLQTPDKQQ
jgi:TrmH family RNA methyltransferase